MKRILIVEDNVMTLELFKNVLSRDGYDVDTAENGNIALEKMMIGGYDLVLMDVMMPGKSGVDVLKALCEKTPKKKNAKVIIVTNLSDQSIRKQAKDCGVSEILDKENLSDPEALLKKVKAVLTGK